VTLPSRGVSCGLARISSQNPALRVAPAHSFPLRFRPSAGASGARVRERAALRDGPRWATSTCSSKGCLQTSLSLNGLVSRFWAAPRWHIYIKGETTPCLNAAGFWRGCARSPRRARARLRKACRVGRYNTASVLKPAYCPHRISWFTVTTGKVGTRLYKSKHFWTLANQSFRGEKKKKKKTKTQTNPGVFIFPLTGSNYS